jgi:hypothetical protein
VPESWGAIVLAVYPSNATSGKPYSVNLATDYSKTFPVWQGNPRIILDGEIHKPSRKSRELPAPSEIDGRETKVMIPLSRTGSRIL